MTLTTDRPTATGLDRALKVTSVLAVLAVAFQFVTAGQLFPRGGPEEVHAGGAIALHLFSGLAAVTAVLLWQRACAPVRLAVLAVVVFALTFVQAALGGRSTLWIHVPGAMLVAGGTVWLAVWAFHLSARR
jgi:hypothetical protein